ncbi:MAG: hypothetical protein LBU34_08880 [Planctomycetaceae bacterium]|jgi:hypothetical protein|nr:hypothetical protein [Planctomycetaceae bacterium]
MKKDIFFDDHWSELALQFGINNPNKSNNSNSETISDSEESLISEENQEKVADKPSGIIANPPEIQDNTALCSNPPEPEPDSFAKGLSDETETITIAQEMPPSPLKQEIKKKFFERFPKINLFGTPPVNEPPEPVAEGTKPPVTHFNTENVFLDMEKTSEKTICTEEHTQAIVDILDPWSKVASQIGVLGTSESRTNLESSVSPGQFSNTSATVETDQNTGQPGGFNTNSNSNPPNRQLKYHHDKKRPFRELPSMFDEPTPESEESAALKNLMETEQDDTEAEKRLRSIFSEEEQTSELTVFEEIDPRKRNDEFYGYSDDRPKTFSRRSEIEKEQPFAVNEDYSGKNDGYFERSGIAERPRESVRERGRRGTRFEQREEKTERYAAKSGTKFDTKSGNEEKRLETATYWEDVPVWDTETEEPKFAEPEPSYNKHRRGKNIERNRSNKDYRPLPEETTNDIESNTDSYEDDSNEDNDLIQLHKNIPSWDEAIHHLIENNIAHHVRLPRGGGGGRK